MKPPTVKLTLEEIREHQKKAHEFVESQPAELSYAIAAELGLVGSLGELEYQRWAKFLRGED